MERNIYSTTTDCQEQLISLLSQLELFGGDKIKQILDNHFGCRLRYLVKCKYGHIFERDENHMSLTLPIKDITNLSDSFNKFTEGEILDGDNNNNNISGISDEKNNNNNSNKSISGAETPNLLLSH